jgi:hypothetical protein
MHYSDLMKILGVHMATIFRDLDELNAWTNGNGFWEYTPTESDFRFSHFVMVHGRKVRWNGVEYKSINEAAKALGISPGTMSDRIKKGYTSDDHVSNVGGSVPCSWNGIEYSSMTDAANALGIDVSSLRYRIQRGYTCDDDLRK